MKKFAKVVLALSLALGCVFTLAACKKEQKPTDTFMGALSTESYKSEEEAIEGFLANEISGEAVQAKLEDYEEKGDLSSKQIDGLVTEGVLDSDDKIISAKEVEVQYSRENKTRDVAPASEEYYVFTVYVVVVSPKGSQTYEYKYYVPIAQNGDVLTRSYYADVLDPAKYTNCTQVYKMSLKANIGGTSDINMSMTYTVKIDGNKMFLDIDMMGQKITGYFEYDENSKTMNAWVSANGIYNKAPEGYFENYGLTDIDSFVSMNLPAFDFSFYEKTDFGFKLQDEFLDAYLEDALNSTLGDVGTISENAKVDATLDLYVSEGRLSKMLSSISYSISGSMDGVTLSESIEETLSVEFTDFGTTEITRPAGISAE